MHTTTFNSKVKSKLVSNCLAHLDQLFKLDIPNGRPGTEGELSSGLGLILCNDFIAQNGGQLSVKSEPGVGTAFTFTLPAMERT
jgi:signal transduction histidine kinase